MQLNDNNYFSSESAYEYISNSQIKAFRKCEAMALAELKGEFHREPNDALLIGSYVDIALTGTEEEMEKFKENNPSIFSSRGETKGQLKSQYVQADKMIERAKSDKFFMKTLSGTKQQIMTGDIAGAKVKIKIDSYLPNAIVDLKTCESINKVYYKNGNRMSFIEYFDYVQQGAIYQEIVKQNTGKELPFFLSCISKEKETDIEVIQIDNESLSEKLIEVSEFIPHIQALKNGEYDPIPCGRCAYCRSKKKLSSPINWREVQIGEE